MFLILVCACVCACMRVCVRESVCVKCDTESRTLKVPISKVTLPVLVKILCGYFKGFNSKSRNRLELSIQLKINCLETHVKMINFPKF